MLFFRQINSILSDIMKKTLIAMTLLATAATAGAKVELGPAIGDNMVLQQNSSARIYGKAAPGSDISVTPSWNSITYKAKAGADGRWMLEVATPAGGFTPWEIEISDGDPLTLQNVLVGEVWLASGQSNMEMPLKGFPGCNVLDGYDEIAAADAKAGKIRFFTVPLTQSYEPLDTVDARWEVPSPETTPDFSATAWYFANRLADVLQVPVGIVSDAYGGAKVESWTPRDILEQYADVSLKPEDVEQMVHYYRPMLMYNAMFNPMKNYTYRGIIWYQGCSNTSTYDTYAERLANMVGRWRSEIALGDIPFYSVEIAPYQYDNPVEQGRSAFLREAQHKAMDMIPNSGIICINDLVEPFERYNIHPGKKSGVGKRLADLALNKTYGRTQFLAESPRYKSHRFEDGAAWVTIDSPSNGICRNYDIRGFEVAGPDKVFHAADSVYFKWQTNEFRVSSKDVAEPVALRYCFRDFLPGTLYGGNYLPLIPFRTDSWTEPTD